MAVVEVAMAVEEEAVVVPILGEGAVVVEPTSVVAEEPLILAEEVEPPILAGVVAHRISAAEVVLNLEVEVSVEQEEWYMAP